MQRKFYQKKKQVNITNLIQLMTISIIDIKFYTILSVYGCLG